MSDKFGNRTAGSRVASGGGFYAKPAVDVPAGAIFMPKYAASALFGIAEAPVAAGELGYFATSGTFVFEKPVSHTSSAGQPIYYAPTDAASGSISASASSGAVLIGWEVLRDDVPDGLISIDIARPTALESDAA